MSRYQSSATSEYAMYAPATSGNTTNGADSTPAAITGRRGTMRDMFASRGAPIRSVRETPLPRSCCAGSVRRLDAHPDVEAEHVEREQHQQRADDHDWQPRGVARQHEPEADHEHRQREIVQP